MYYPKTKKKEKQVLRRLADEGALVRVHRRLQRGNEKKFTDFRSELRERERNERML